MSPTDLLPLSVVVAIVILIAVLIWRQKRKSL